MASLREFKDRILKKSIKKRKIQAKVKMVSLELKSQITCSKPAPNGNKISALLPTMFSPVSTGLLKWYLWRRSTVKKLICGAWAAWWRRSCSVWRRAAKRSKIVRRKEFCYQGDHATHYLQMSRPWLITKPAKLWKMSPWKSAPGIKLSRFVGYWERLPRTISHLWRIRMPLTTWKWQYSTSTSANSKPYFLQPTQPWWIYSKASSNSIPTSASQPSKPSRAPYSTGSGIPIMKNQVRLRLKCRYLNRILLTMRPLSA